MPAVDTIPPYHRARTFASLYTIVSGNDINVANATTFDAEVNGQLRINFPAMPETINLARQATYESLRTPAAPDGFHWYKHTDPLVIPIKFSLAGFDRDYCRDDGSYALLDTAAKLHAMTMPIIPARIDQTRQAPSVINGQAGTDASLLASAQGSSSQSAGANTPSPSSVSNAVNITVGQDRSASATLDKSADAVYYPPACVLSIVLAELPGRAPLGIRCVGFVSSVDVTFHGPWLQGGSNRGGAIVNMPTKADFEFRFTHQPNYTNARMANENYAGNLYTTTASIVRNRLYNQFAAGTPQASSVQYADLFGKLT